MVCSRKACLADSLAQVVLANTGTGQRLVATMPKDANFDEYRLKFLSNTWVPSSAAYGPAEDLADERLPADTRYEILDRF